MSGFASQVGSGGDFGRGRAGMCPKSHPISDLGVESDRVESDRWNRTAHEFRMNLPAIQPVVH